MADGRVTVDDTAHRASKTLQTVLNNNLPEAFKQLRNAGNDLVNPQHWDGKAAVDFRANVWPKVQTDLQKMQSSLMDLQKTVDKILINISQAGGN